MKNEENSEATVLISCQMCRKHELIIFEEKATYTLSSGKSIKFPQKVCFCPILADKRDKDCYFYTVDIVNWNVARIRDALKEVKK